MDDLIVRQEDQLEVASSGVHYLVPRERRQWVALGLTVASIGLVLAWMWGSLVVLATNWLYVAGFVVLAGIWVGVRFRRTKKARGRILEALERAGGPLATPELLKLMARKKLSPEVVTAELQVLLGEGVVEADSTENGITYKMVGPE